MRWSRLYNDEAQDRRIRYVAASAGCQPVVVLGVLTAMKCHASEQRDERRGTLAGFDTRVVAFDLGLEPPMLMRIKVAMEGHYLDGDRLIDWEKMQYASDGSTERWRKWAEKQRKEKQEVSEEPTLDKRWSNVGPTRKSRAEQSREEEQPPTESVRRASRATTTRGHRLPDGWVPTAEDAGFADQLGLNPDAVAGKFRDYWTAQPGTKGVKTDWPATWRNWCRREVESGPRQKQPSGKLDWLIEDMRKGAMR